jgi:RND family efflux transporter MFP subunit
MRDARWRVRGLGILLVAASISTACREAPKPPAMASPIPVKVTPVIERDIPIYREWIGTTVGYVTAQIRPKVSGYLASQDYREGMPVKAGDLLFKIDPRQYQNSLDQARGKLAQSQSQRAQAQAQLAQNQWEVEQAKAQVAQAEGDLARAVATQRKTELEVERYRPLVARGSLSQQELDNAVQNNLANQGSVEAERANVEKARASVQKAQAGVEKARADVAAAEAAIAQAQAGLEEAQLNLGWTKVLSPINGIAGIKKADIGDLVGTTTVLTTVATINPIYVQFNPTEQDYLRWREAHPRASAQRPQFELILADGQTYPHLGTADILGLEVDATTGTIAIRVSFPNPENLLRPGQYAKVRVPLAVKKGALMVPQRAVRDTQGLYQVGIIGPEDTASLRTVQVGERSGPWWIIERGLKPGERVVVEGLEKVKAGDKVAPIAAEAEPAGDAAAPVPTPTPATPAPAGAGRNPGQ